MSVIHIVHTFIHSFEPIFQQTWGLSVIALALSFFASSNLLRAPLIFCAG